MSVQETSGLYLTGNDAPQLLVLCGEAYNIIKGGIGAVSDDESIQAWLGEFESFIEIRLVDKKPANVEPMTREKLDSIEAASVSEIIKVRMENQ